MEIVDTPFKACYLLKNRILRDARGYFLETFHQQQFNEITQTQTLFVQDNQSESGYGVVRGLHYQCAPYAQAKLVRVAQGRVLDVIINLQEGSPDFGKTYSVELSDENGLQLFIPGGFGHGFAVLSQRAIFAYKCDAYYQREAEGGINPLDPDLNIDWRIPTANIILSEKDRLAQSWANYRKKIQQTGNIINL